MEETVLPRLAFQILKEAEETFKETGTFSSKILENLYSFFGESFVLATELLEKCKIIEYAVDSGIRNIFKVIMKKEQYTIYEDINFCQCKTFQLQVLESQHTLTCKHVLAVKLARISGQLTKETISDSQFVDFLNEQLRYIEEDDDDNCMKS